MTFDTENPPDNLKDFVKDVKRTLEDAQIQSDEDYDTAIFYVDREGNADVIYAWDIYEEHDQQYDGDEILYLILPHIIRTNNAKIFGLVLSAQKQNDDEVVMLLTGDINETHLFQSEIDREEEFIELEPWERLDVLDFPEISVPFRRAICPQG